MSKYFGDFAAGTTVYMPWDSFAGSTGAPSAASNFAAGDIMIFKDGGTTQRSSSAGITVTTTFDSRTGLQMVAIDLSDNTDAGFYAAGHEYQVAVDEVTVDSQTLRFWLGTFSIERMAALFESILVETGATIMGSLRLANAANGGITSGMGTSNPVIRDLADTKDRIDATVTPSTGERTAVTLDLT